jgi:hypothetical protein
MPRNLDYPMPMHGRMMRQRLWETQRQAGMLFDVLRDDDRVPAWTLDKVAVGANNVGQVSRYLRFKIEHPQRFQPLGFIPSAYSGSEEAQVTADTAKVTAGVAGGAISGAAGAGAVTGLLTAAGVSATVPVVGWVVGGVLAAAGGSVALAMALKDGKVRKDQAIAMAKKLGFGKQAEAVPAFTVSALGWTKAKRKKELARLRKVYAGMKGQKGVFPKLYEESRNKVKMRIRVLEAIAKSETPKSKRSKLSPDVRKGIAAAEMSPKIAPSASETPSEPEPGDEGPMPQIFTLLPPWGWAVAGAGVLGLIALVASRGRRDGASQPRSYRRVA